ncbi:hypothetical protein UKMH10_4777 [Burkholderia pseudomallei]|nr:unnamed protein product [Burkholderia pseudomallei]VUD60969.1 unnamed protein product [Burkholderia pseudomallei]VUD61141.1 unnamed protein product [Burkholderia pseudomallei]VUD66672.1 hypothetical protein UKMH10_4777 [Burkholderia pseudomallei]
MLPLTPRDRLRRAAAPAPGGREPPSAPGRVAAERRRLIVKTKQF